MSSFTPIFLDQIRARISLTGLIGRNIRLIRKGREHVGLCPFHNEKSPSFSVNEEKGFYHCFGCGAHGDIIGFTMQYRRLSFPDAVEQLAQEAGLEMPVQDRREREKARQVASLHDVLEQSTRYFEAQLKGPLGRKAMAYLSERGLDNEAISRFRLGFAPDDRTALKKSLKDFPETLSVESGMLIKPDGGGESHDRFRGRLMFPIADRRGWIIAFGGRTLGDIQPKYLNSPDTPLFHKGDVLYAFPQAREAAAKSGSIIVAEGYMDVIALHSAGFTNAVAPLGTALTEQQLELLWKLVPEPTLCFDGDAAGQRAAMRAAERALTILKPGYSLRFVTMPDKEDPDSLIKKHGKAMMSEILSRAVPMSEMLWQNKFANLPIDTPEQRQGVEKSIRTFFSAIPDQGLSNDYRFDFIRRLRALTRQNFQSFPSSNTLRKPSTRRYVARDMQGKQVFSSVPSNLPPPALHTQERLLLVLVILHPSLLDDVEEKMGELSFLDSRLDKMRQEVLKQPVNWRGLDYQAARDYLCSCGFAEDVERLLDISPLDKSDFFRPDAPVTEAMKAWEHLYGFYRKKDVFADVQSAMQRASGQLTDESFGLFSALWTAYEQYSKN